MRKPPPKPKPPQPGRPPLGKPHDSAPVCDAPADDRARTCIATGEASPPKGLIRFALSPDGVVTPDLAEKLGGRGAWVSADREALARAVSRNLFSRAFRRAATAPEGLVETVEAGLEKRALDALGLARRAGKAALGFDQARKALIEKSAAILISSSDAADDGCEKLSRLGEGVFHYRGLSSAALSAAFGKEGVRHAALMKGAAAERFRREAARLEGFRAKTPADGDRQPARTAT